ncbi:carbohydrate ABC transporter permease [Paenibacillus pasadenensis]|uniref:N-Acetyl-D-glucosamine ABC transport system, permease protein 2 n=1 Tax=Paenibacillus pasadenensis TaxID=217090 RepID=A0A2N5N9X6_9BACL|nr:MULTISPECIES: carbohydrate ABC transporter permease [Paenibacillus]PLT47156.1 N-Acetyl-D-glucosamine ABC transport system, permease protein 2 [Paenibacillus pasadenensis]QGG57480.1 ABC transporter permease subunit [Paenibacillus sp. B01]
MKQATTRKPASAAPRGRLQQWAAGIVLTVFGIAMVLPFVWMVLSAFKTEGEIKRIPPTLWPEAFTVDNFTRLFTEMDFGTYLGNTLLITLFSFVGLLLNAMAGFGFAKYRFKGREKLFLLVLATMMIPGQVTMIPVYLILNGVSLTNTMLGIVLPGFTSAFGIFLFRQFMSTLPEEIMEATRLDGASEYRLFAQVVLPMSKPILAVQAILTFIGGWNSFLWPLIIANDEKLYTLSVGLQLLKGQNTTNFALQMAGAAFMVLPIMVIFIFFQRQIIENYNISGIK